MDRKGFLKRLFGAAVVAAMPKVVVDQIESLPEPIPIPPVEKDVIECVKEQIGENTYKPEAVVLDSDNVLLIYNKDSLVGISNYFQIKAERKYSPTMELAGSPYIDFLMAPMSCKIAATNINWYDGVNLNDILMSDDLHFLAKHIENNIKLTGDIITTQMDIDAGMYTPITTSATFTVTGAIIVEPNDNTTTT